MSRQALILRRRHTQQRPSDCSVAPAEPQTRHLKVFTGRGLNTVSLAFRIRRGSTTGSSMVFFFFKSASRRLARLLPLGLQQFYYKNNLHEIPCASGSLMHPLFK